MERIEPVCKKFDRFSYFCGQMLQCPRRLTTAPWSCFRKRTFRIRPNHDVARDLCSAQKRTIPAPFDSLRRVPPSTSNACSSRIRACPSHRPSGSATTPIGCGRISGTATFTSTSFPTAAFPAPAPARTSASIAGIGGRSRWARSSKGWRQRLLTFVHDRPRAPVGRSVMRPGVSAILEAYLG
jgi:hypothetical protein